MPDFSEHTLKAGNLVVYKLQPAYIETVEKSGKFAIKTLEKGNLRVRDKDVQFLHPGPINNFSELTPPPGEVKTAWELLAGDTTTLPELAELAFEEYSPASAWAVWELLEDALYFHGSVEEIVARSEAEVAEITAERTAKAEEAARWAGFVSRVEAKSITPADGDLLGHEEQLALGQVDYSHLLNALNHSETPESAHTLLLSLGHWDETLNPYPARLNLPTDIGQAPLPPPNHDNRRDLTHLPAFAIDDAGNKDPDDALSVDGPRLWVHIADVAALVSPNSPADALAQHRTATLYLPEKSVPMLPPEALPQLGLGLQTPSPALSFGIILGPDGSIEQVDITPSWVNVTRLSYAQANQALKAGDSDLQTLYRWASRFRERRIAQGSIEIDLPEVKVRLDPATGDINIKPILPLKSRMLVQESMLMAGEAVARFATDHQIPLAFATQPPPFERDDLPSGMAGMYAQRRAMKRGEYKSTPGPHTGLGLDHYVQATSPLRRYLDLVAHQQLRAYLEGRPLLTEQDILERVASVNAVYGALRRAERQSNTHWKLVYLQRHPYWQDEGVVVEQRGRKSTVLIPSLELETDLYLREDVSLNSILDLRVRSINLPYLSAQFDVVD